MSEDANDPLSLIGRVKPGETINIRTREIVVLRSWYGWFTRYFGNENHNALLQWLDQMMGNELDELRYMVRLDLIEQQKNKVLEAFTGIRNLIFTYRYKYPVMLEQLNNMLRKYEKIYWDINPGKVIRNRVPIPASYFDIKYPDYYSNSV